MIFEYIEGDNSRNIIDLSLSKERTDDFETIEFSSKLEFIQQFIPAYRASQKLVLFDKNHKQLLKFHQENNINSLANADSLNADTQLLFFTSGSSGFPVGAFKTRENLESEGAVLKALAQRKNIKKVVVTVPFVHIYGILAGLLLPLSLGDVTLVVKEDFLPYELLEEAKDGETLIVTTPVFIKALGKLNESNDLSSCTFISSTGPLHSDDASLLESKYQTTLLQLFGSTETGGIAYKEGDSSKWIPMDRAEVKTCDDKLSVSSPFISKHLLDGEIKELEQPFVTEDIIKLDEDGFTLLGRSNKIIKIAGKRISATQIESILETIEDVNAAIVELVYKKELLRSEQILITLESSRELSKKEIKEKISEYYGVLTIPFKVNYVEKINYSAMGKKVLF